MKYLSGLLFLASIAVALPTNGIAAPVEISKRQCYVQCGDNCYSSDQVSEASNAAYNYVQSGETAGSSTYPHVYNDYEGFDFPVSGPYYEFPILTSGVYSGGESGQTREVEGVLTIQGSPGADRVVIDSNGDLAGEITHTGASGNNFVQCSGS